MSTQKLLVARRAVEYGTTTAMKFFAKKYPELLKQLNETSVHRLKNLYQEYLQVKGDVPSEKELKNFLQKKNGRPLKIGEELDKQVRDMSPI